MKPYDEIIKVRVYESPQVFQELYAYLTYQYEKVDIELKMQLFLKPQDLRADVYAALNENWIPQLIDDLKYTLSPEILWKKNPW